jgi:hypothetical protein
VSFDLATWSIRSTVNFPQKSTTLAISPAKNLLFVGDWEGVFYLVRQDDFRIHDERQPSQQ